MTCNIAAPPVHSLTENIALDPCDIKDLQIYFASVVTSTFMPITIAARPHNFSVTISYKHDPLSFFP